MTSGRICALILAILMLIPAFGFMRAASAITPKNVDLDAASEQSQVPGGAVLAFVIVSWTAAVAGMIGSLLWIFSLFILIILACRTSGKWRIAMWCTTAAAALIGILLLSL